MSLNRRSFIVGSAAVASGPALGAVSASGEVDVAIIGAGAAGIAAARKVAAAGKRYVLLEASDRIGGRCVTDVTTFGIPYDRGAHWLHMPDINPVARLAARVPGMDVYQAPPGQKLRIAKRNAREGEMEDYLATIVRAGRAIQEAARAAKGDISCAQALPKDLGDWKPAVDFVLGPFGCGKNLDDISAIDFARSAERDIDSFCRQGLGALLAKLGADLTVQTKTPVTRLQVARNTVEMETPRGYVRARAAIVTASTNVLAAEKIKILDLPKRQLDAIAKLSLGSYDHIALELKGNPLQLRNDDLVFEKSTGPRTAALLANVSGTPLALVEVGGKFGAELAKAGEAAMTDFALQWLSDLFGTDVKKAVGKTHATRWNAEPFALGAFSAAAVNGQGGRRILMEPLRDRLFFAGEAVHETLWGTVGGAWESGERAADAALKLWGRR
ncbi:MAG: FAD-dependent oxidoreductase [Alphaproteobacteria bacterium]|nr:FAD-dependent oxidoreductase [Alphaproteobacteria bacterium]